MTRIHRVLQRLARLWWAALVVLGLVALALGIWGYRNATPPPGLSWSRWDVFYLSLQLFTVNFTPTQGAVTVPLEVARFLAAFVAFSTVITTVVRIFYDRLQLLWLMIIRNHVILCGLGLYGTRLVEALRERGDRVVVIEADPRHDGLAHCRALGAVVLVGAATDRWFLRQARVDHARLLMVLYGDDGNNVETAVRAQTLKVERPRGKLRCVLQVSDPRLRILVQTHSIFNRSDTPFELQAFNLYEVGARVMLRESLPGTSAADASAKPAEPCLLVVGLGRLGETLLLRAAKDWRLDRRAPEERLTVILVAPNASSRVQALVARHPVLVDACVLECHDLDVRGPAFQRGDCLFNGSGMPVTAAFVCIGDEALGLLTAQRLDELLKERKVPIQVRMTENTGLTRLFERGAGLRADGPSVVGLQDISCTMALVVDPLREILAQAIHQEYLRHQSAQGQTTADNQALVPWRELPAVLQESNRHQADHVHDKLRAIGYRAVAVAQDVVSPRAFSDGEVETLGQIEHQRFVDERRSAGWRLGPKRDHSLKISPFLVPWDQLSEEVKELDRNAVRKLPLILAKADYTIEPIA